MNVVHDVGLGITEVHRTHAREIKTRVLCCLIGRGIKRKQQLMLPRPANRKAVVECVPIVHF